MAGQGSRGAAARTERRQSPEVYRRRRIAALILIALIVGVLGVGVWAAVVAVSSTAGTPAPTGPAADAPASQPTDGASPSSSATDGTASAGATPTATPTCDPHLVTVAASTDKPTYAPEEKPVFTLTVTNGNPVPCDVNVGTKQMEFLVVSGTDRIFSSKDCQADPQDLTKTIPAGGSEKANFPWARIRSAEGCKAVTVQPRPGVYVLTASLGATTSSKAVFRLN